MIKGQVRTQLIQKTLLTERQEHLVKLLFSKEFVLHSEQSEPNEDHDKRNDRRIWSDCDSDVLDQLEKEPDTLSRMAARTGYEHPFALTDRF